MRKSLVTFRRRLLTQCAGLLLASSVTASPEHVVQGGESLWLLARKYGVTVEALQAANRLATSDRIRAGQTLRIPGNRPAAVGAPKEDKNRVTPAQARTTERTATAEAAPTAVSTATASKITPVPSSRQLTVAPPAKVTEVKKNSPSTRDGAATRLPPLSERNRLAAEQLYSTATPRVAPNTLTEVVPSWVLSEPPATTQGEKPTSARGGIFPCAAPDPGFAHYAKWIQVAPMAHVLAPPASPNLSSVRADGSFDVVFHFHGREPMRKEWVRAMSEAHGDAVLVAVDIGIASEPYRETFRDARTFGQMLLAVEQEMKRRSSNTHAFAQNVTLSSWSAGYGAVAELLGQPMAQTRVGSVVLLDGLHAGFASSGLDGEKLAPFVHFAKQAAEGKRMMFVSHSSIRTPGYASTTQTARYLAWQVGGKPKDVSPGSSDPMGLERYSTFSKGNFHVRGFRGSGASDHCAHLGLMRDVLTVHLQPFWRAQQPSGRPVALATLER
jgi:LysM repeat protein